MFLKYSNIMTDGADISFISKDGFEREWKCTYTS